MIGVLGGMGPESTAYTYMCMIRYCQQKYAAVKDSDYPPIILYSMPIPDVVEKQAEEAIIFPLLEKGISKLKDAEAQFCIIPCNSIQYFVPRLRKTLPMLSITEETIKAAEKTSIRKWALLGTVSTVKSGQYQQLFSKSGMDIIEPNSEEQKLLTKAIMNILSGKKYDDANKALLWVLSSMKKRGAMGAILACTDLPIVLRQAEDMQLLDTADIIAKAAVDYYIGNMKKLGATSTNISLP